LIAAEARALIAGNAFDAALALLDGDVSPMSVTQLTALRESAILAITDRTEDAAFLNFAFDALPETGSARAENAVATRLMTLGFADRADAVLDSPATGAEARDRRYLQSEIAIATGNSDAVEGLLAGMTDPRSAEIRARALAAQGDFAAAATTDQIFPGAAPDPSEAWRAGEWAVLEQSEDPLLRAASDAVLSESPSIDPDAPLASSRAMLEDAAATEDLAGQLLDRFAVDPAEAEPASH
jgi:hypothetical protein